MKITRIAITNFRNLNGIDVKLNPEINFLLGENEVGKSNFLELLDILFNRRAFARSDYYDENVPIEVKITITLTDEELGTFEDYFDPSNHNQANFIAKQDSADDLIVFYRAENYETDPKEISQTPFRRLNYIKYSSLRSPKDELGFDSDRGVGRFLNYLARSTLEDNKDKPDFINNSALDPIIQKINATLEKIKPLHKMGIGTFADQEHQAELLARILLLKSGNELDILKSGQGIQFSILLILSILERLIALKTSRRFKENIFTAPRLTITRTEIDEFLQQENRSWDDIRSLVNIESDEVSFSAENLNESDEVGNKLKRVFERKGATIILGLDEPEIHLHPYMQRSLIKYIARILTNEDSNFTALLRDLLDLDEISGQAIVVSHSPSILLTDYKQIVRFYKENGTIRSISGCQLTFDQQLEKQLWMQFPSITEAFFSKCVIIVEGKTEYGAMSIWKDTYLEDADDLGISVIGADACSSIEPIVKLLNALKIPNVSIMDRDSNNPSLFQGVPGLAFTKGRDFEEEIYEDILSSEPNCETLFEFLTYVNSGLSTFRKKKYLIEAADKYGIKKTWDQTIDQFTFSDEVVKTNSDLRKTMFIDFMGMVKSITFGRFVASHTKRAPSVYINVLDEAKNKAEQVK